MVTTNNETSKFTNKGNKVTTLDKDKMIDLYKDGYNGKQIGEKLGISPHTVNYHLCKYKKHKRPVGRPLGSKNASTTAAENPALSNRMTDQDRLKLMDMHVQGFKQCDIAKELGVHFSTPSNYFTKLKKAGQYDRECRRAQKRVSKQSLQGITSTDSHTKYNRKGTLIEKITGTKSTMASELKAEIMQEIKQEMKEQILRELLGK